MAAIGCSLLLNAKNLTVNGLELQKGNTNFIEENAKVALTIDFSHAICVEYDGDDKTVKLNKGLMLDSIPADEWKNDLSELYLRIVEYFNEAAKKAGKPIRMTANPEDADYDYIITVDTIDVGSTGAALWVRHAGCAIGTGDVLVKNRRNGEVVCQLHMDKVVAEWTDIVKVDRLLRLYGWELMGKYLFNATMQPIPFSTKFKMTIH